jgi:hypothetical protein
MAARYRSGYLVSGGVERSSTQKPWRPESAFTRKSLRIPCFLKTDDGPGCAENTAGPPWTRRRGAMGAQIHRAR